MPSKFHALIAAAGLTACAAGGAAEYPIDIRTDIKGQYFVVEKSGSTNNPVLVTKQVGPDKSTYFIKRWFDCRNWTVRYLGEGDTLEAMAKAAVDVDSTAIAEGSIPDQLARHICPPPHPGRP